jgi:hypothetical protein
MTLVDSNVWIDLIQRDPNWFEWSFEALKSAQRAGPIYVNAVVRAELAGAYDHQADLDQFLLVAKAVTKAFSSEAAYVAGRAFLQYRRRKGTKSGVLPDFFIGAQAQTEGWPLLTRDAHRYKTYFPKVKLISP